MKPSVEYDFDPFKLPDRLLQAIGMVMAASSQTESILNMAVAGFLGVDAEYGMALTAHMSVPLKLSIAHAIGEIRIDDLDALDKLDELLTTVKDALDLRNSTAHDSWCRNPGTNETYRAVERARVRLEAELVPTDAIKLIKDANTICAAGLNLMGFLSTYNLFPSMPSGNRPRGHKSKAARKVRRTKAGKKGL